VGCRAAAAADDDDDDDDTVTRYHPIMRTEVTLEHTVEQQWPLVFFFRESTQAWVPAYVSILRMPLVLVQQ
jgi:hypothetical protein